MDLSGEVTRYARTTLSTRLVVWYSPTTCKTKPKVTVCNVRSICHGYTPHAIYDRQHIVRSWGESLHDDVIKWKHFPNLDVFFGCAWTNGWVNTRDTGDLRRHWGLHSSAFDSSAGQTRGSHFNFYWGTDTTLWSYVHFYVLVLPKLTFIAYCGIGKSKGV